MEENQAQLESSNFLGGESVYFKYEPTQNAMEHLTSVVRDLNSNIEQVKNIIEQKDSIWKGPAGDRFWEQISAKGKEYSTEEMESMASQKMPTAITAVLDLIDQNKAVDSELMSQTFTEAQANDSIQANSTTTDAYGVNQEGNAAVQANDGIKANSTTTDAQGVDQELDNSVKANDAIQANSTTTDAQGVNTGIINDTKVNGNIHEAESNVTAEGQDTDLYNRVGTSGAFNNGSSTDTSEATQASSNFDDALSALE